MTILSVVLLASSNALAIGSSIYYLYKSRHPVWEQTVRHHCMNSEVCIYHRDVDPRALGICGDYTGVMRALLGIIYRLF